MKAFWSTLVAAAALSAVLSARPDAAATSGGGTYTAVSVQYRSGIDDPIQVSPNDPLRVTIWWTETIGGSYELNFEPGMTRRQLAEQLKSLICAHFPEHCADVSVNGATVILKNTDPKTGGTPSKPNESSTNHNRPWLSSYTKTV